MRTHVILPHELVCRIDQLVGKRKRSRFVEKAVREKLEREALLAALKETAGIFSAEEHPEWATPEGTARWQHELRRQDEARLQKVTHNG